MLGNYEAGLFVFLAYIFPYTCTKCASEKNAWNHSADAIVYVVKQFTHTYTFKCFEMKKKTLKANTNINNSSRYSLVKLVLFPARCSSSIVNM